MTNPPISPLGRCLAILLVLSFSSCFLCAISSAQELSPRQKQWLEDEAFHPELSSQNRLSLIQNLKPWEDGGAALLSLNKDLPARVVNTEFLPPVRTQASQPSCVYWATCYYQLTWQEAREKNIANPHPENKPEITMNHEFVWKLGSMYDVLKYLGCGSYAYMPSEWDDEIDFPTTAGFAEARLHRVKDFYSLPTDPAEAMTALKQRLADGYIVATSLGLYENFSDYHGGTGSGYDNDVYYENQGNPAAAHALTFIGYDDNRSYNDGTGQKSGAFLLVNSWGTNWGCTVEEVGTPGFIWMSYDYAADSGLIYNSVLMEGQPSVDDKNFARIEVDHNAFVELSTRIYASDPQNPSESIPLGNLFGNIGVHSPIDIGIDRLVQSKSLGFRFSLLDMDLTGGMLGEDINTGLIKEFSIKIDEAPTTWTAEGMPVATVDCRNLTDADERAEKTFNFDLSLLEKKYTRTDFSSYLLDRQMFVQDFDHDGDPDLLAGCPWQFWLNNGEGRFESIDVTSLNEHYRVADIADFNGDNWLDLIVRVDDNDTPENSYFTIYYGSQSLDGFTDSGLRFYGSIIGLGNAAAVDFNQDGLMDLSTVGWRAWAETDTPSTFRIWLNQGGGAFIDSGVRINRPDCGTGPMAWGDFTGDGRPDLIFSAAVSSYYDWGTVVRDRIIAFENSGGTSLLESQAFGESDISALHLVDLTGDGRLDLAASRVYPDAEKLLLYANDGTGQFIDLEHNLTDLRTVGQMCFGDINHDGLCDMTFQAETGDSEKDVTAAYLNAGNGQFRYLAGPDEDLDRRGAQALADFDADGDLDWLVMGYYYKNYPDPRMYFYENLTDESNRLARPNTAPEKPTLLSASRISANDIILQWRAGNDDFTTASSLLWRVRAGSVPGKGDIFQADLDLLPLAIRPMENTGTFSASLNIELEERAFVQVQAVDTAGAESTWSSAIEVLVAGNPSLFDLNSDGRVDAGDIVALHHFANATDATTRARADLNGDGQYTHYDRALIVDFLMDRDMIAEDADDVLIVTSDGLKYNDGKRAISFPPGWTDTPVSLVLAPAVAAAPFDNLQVDHFFRLEGMPIERDSACTFKINAPGLSTDDTRLLMAGDFTPSSVWEKQRTWQSIPAVGREGDWLVFELPATVPQTAPRAMPGPDSSILAAPYSLEVQTNIFGIATGITRAESDHFIVDYPSDMDAAPILAMLDGLEWTYNTWQNDFKMNFAEYRLFSGKTEVDVQKLENRYDGYYQSFWNEVVINRNYVVNTMPLNEARHVRTAIHEFSHKVLACYMPMISNNNEYATLWAEEAFCVWMETVYAPGILPDVCSQNMHKVFKSGMPQLRKSTSEQAHYGYGLTTIIHELVTRQVNDNLPSAFWKSIAAGKPVITALEGASGQACADFWTPFVQDLVAGHNLPFSWMDVDNAVGENIFDITKLTQEQLDINSSKMHSFLLEDVSAAMVQTILDKTRLDEDMVLSHRLSWKNSRLELSGFQQHLPADIDLLTQGSDVNEVVKMDFPLTGMLSDDKYRVLSLLTSPEHHIGEYASGLDFTDTTHPGYAIATLELAITQDKKWDFPTPNTATNGGYGFSPRFDSVISFEGPGLADVEFIDITPDAGYYLIARAFGVPPIDYKIKVSSACVIGSYSSGSTIYEAGPVKYYRMEYEPETYNDFFTPSVAVESVAGEFTLPLSTTSTYVNATLYAVYDVTVTIGEDETVMPNEMTALSYIGLLP